ncbi:MAG: MXAN_5187 C-terminal domain-containing protein, partial [Myxococcota bacterium]
APAPAPAPAPTVTAPSPAAPPMPAPPPPAAAPPAAAPPAPAPAAADPDEDFHEIFEEFVQVKQACGEPTENLTYDRFAAKLRKNERDLKKKRPNIKRVQFSVYVKDGKAALKAKVIK